MIGIDIPGWGSFSIHHLVLDLNGTLTLDGDLIPGVRERIDLLSGKLNIHVLTADTLGQAADVTRDLPVTLHVIEKRNQREAKQEYLRCLPSRSAAVGNGRNDAGMLGDAALGIAVMGPEGAFPETLHAAHVVVKDINDALDLLIIPDRLRATLRN
jgi:soluble P-type ATPase